MSKTSLLSKTKLKHPKAIIKTYSNDLSGSFAVTLAELFERKKRIILYNMECGTLDVNITFDMHLKDLELVIFRKNRTGKDIIFVV